MFCSAQYCYPCKLSCCTVTKDVEFWSNKCQISKGCHYVILSYQRLGIPLQGLWNTKFWNFESPSCQLNNLTDINGHPCTTFNWVVIFLVIVGLIFSQKGKKGAAGGKIKLWAPYSTFRQLLGFQAKGPVILQLNRLRDC